METIDPVDEVATVIVPPFPPWTFEPPGAPLALVVPVTAMASRVMLKPLAPVVVALATILPVTV